MVQVFSPKGRLDASRIRIERAQLERAAAVQNELVIDMSQVSYLDPSGIGYLAFLHKRLSERGGGVTVINVAGQPRHVFADMQLAEFIEDGSRETATGTPVSQWGDWARSMTRSTVARRSLRALRSAPQIAMQQIGGTLAWRRAAQVSERRDIA